MGAQVAFVPNVNFDLLLYADDVGPIALSLKVSLRERYKQADLEAIALKYVHRKSENYLLTTDENEARLVRNKNKAGELIGGLDDIIYIFSAEFDQLIVKLKKHKYIEPGSINIIQKSVGIIR